MSESLGASLFVCFFTILALAMYYTIIGSSFSLHTTGLLIKADVYQHHSDDGGSSYYRSEIFQYNITSHKQTTCTLVRPWYYMFYGSAQDAVENTKLGTTRDIWIASYNDHTCSDTTLKNYNITIGITLFCVIGIIMLSILFALSYDTIIKYYKSCKSKIRTENYNLDNI